MAAALTSIMGLSSCLDDDDENYYYINYPNALVTVKSDADDSFSSSWMTVQHCYR